MNFSRLVCSAALALSVASGCTIVGAPDRASDTQNINGISDDISALTMTQSDAMHAADPMSKTVYPHHYQLPEEWGNAAPHSALAAAGKRVHILPMTAFVTILLVLAMIGTLGVLGMGVATMLRGGDPRRSNKLMQSRVIMQALALVLLAVLMMLARH
jgi:hypothetical protein